MKWEFYKSLGGQHITPCPHYNTIYINSLSCQACSYWKGNNHKDIVYCAYDKENNDMAKEKEFLLNGLDFHLSSAELMINGYLLYSEVNSDNLYTAGFSKTGEGEEIKTKDKNFASLAIESYLTKIKEEK